MKLLHLIFFSIMYSAIYADGVDKISIYINNRFITTTNEMKDHNLNLIINDGDTVKFVVWTDWGGQFNSSIDVWDSVSKKIYTMEKINDRQYEATFYYIVNSKFINDRHRFVLNYNSTKIEPWEFVSIIFKGP